MLSSRRHSQENYLFGRCIANFFFPKMVNPGQFVPISERHKTVVQHANFLMVLKIFFESIYLQTPQQISTKSIPSECNVVLDDGWLEMYSAT
jgi:hypothetical protein